MRHYWFIPVACVLISAAIFQGWSSAQPAVEPESQAVNQATPEVGESGSSEVDELARLRELEQTKANEFSNVDMKDYLAGSLQLETGPYQNRLVNDRVGFWAMRFLDQPFRLHSVSTDLVDADCVTFAERCIALACAEDWSSYYRILRRLEYRNGSSDVLDKNFDPIADWIPNNAWLLSDISGQLGVEADEFAATIYKRRFMANTRYGDPQEASGVSEHAIQLGAYAEYKWAATRAGVLREQGIDAVIEQQKRGDRDLWILMVQYGSHEEAVLALPFIRSIQNSAKLTQASMATAKADRVAATPETEDLIMTGVGRRNIPTVLNQLQNGDIFFVIRECQQEKCNSLFICDHEGIIVRDGATVLAIHCTSPQVRAEPLMQLVDKFNSIRGLKFLRLKPNAAEVVVQELGRLGPAIHAPEPAQEDARIQTLRQQRLSRLAK